MKRRVPNLGAIRRVVTDQPMVALSFDDGPDPTFTPKFLDVLDAHGARGTFFMLGERASARPDLVRDVAARDHEIATHGFDHLSHVLDAPRGPVAAAAWRRQQIQRGMNAVHPARPRLLRPPFGHTSLAACFEAGRMGLEVVLWDIAVVDWLEDRPSDMARRTLEALGPGSIVLFHDGLADPIEARFVDRRPALDALERILCDAEPDLRFVTVSELLAAGEPVRRYRHPSGHDPSVAERS